jgi:Protein of unknown function (DUF3485)
MARIVLISIAVIAVLLDGYVYGLWTDRWGNAQAVEDAVARLELVPMTIGDWQARPLELPEKHAKQAGFAGYWLRRYEHRDGAAVNVLLACGRPGPLSVHTPDICYAGAGFVQSELAVKHTTSADHGTAAEFSMAKFGKPEALVPQKLRVFWSWRGDGGWTVPGNPRFAFASQPVIHKLYVTHEMVAADERQDDAICTEFINLLVPALDKALTAQP